MPKTATPTDILLTQATIDHLNNAKTAARNAAEELRDQRRKVGELGTRLVDEDFRVREYPGRYLRGCQRAEQRLIYAAQALDIVIGNINKILGGHMPGDLAVDTDYIENFLGGRSVGKVSVKPEAVRAALAPFGGAIADASATRGKLKTVTSELQAATGAKGLATPIKNVEIAAGFISRFELYFAQLRDHVRKMLHAVEAWDKDGRPGKHAPGMPPMKIKLPKKTARDTFVKGKVENAKGLPGRGNKDVKAVRVTPRKDRDKPAYMPGKEKVKGGDKATLPGKGKPGQTSAAKGLAAALEQLKKGVREVGSSNTGTDVNKYLGSTGLGGGYPWCAAFVRWCMERGGFKFPSGTSWAACEQYQAEARRKGGTMFVVGHGQARAGDLIVWGGRHIGIVESLSGGTIHYVAGNEGDAVRRGTRPTSDGSYTIIRLRQQ